MKRMLIALLIVASGAGAQEGSVDRETGIAAWDRIFAVAAHPRCTNCHVGAQDKPMWLGLAYAENRPHGMGIRAGESRIGAETIPCRACHVTSGRRNTVPHAAPHIPDAWRLPPVELGWLEMDSAALCAQLRDPEDTGETDIAELIDHLQTSPFVAWGFEPGAGRTAPVGTVAALVRDVMVWGDAGAPCR